MQSFLLLCPKNKLWCRQWPFSSDIDCNSDATPTGTQGVSCPQDSSVVWTCGLLLALKSVISQFLTPAPQPQNGF